MLTLLLIFIINYLYFYTGFDRYLYDFSRANLIQESEDVTLTSSHINILSEDDRLEVRRLLAIQEELKKEIQYESKLEIQDESKIEIQDESKLEIQYESKIEIQDESKIEIQDESKIEIQDESKKEIKYQLTLEEKADSNWDKNRLSEAEILARRAEVELAEKLVAEVAKEVLIEMKKIDSSTNQNPTSSNTLIAQLERYFMVKKNNLSIKYIRFFAELKHRKISNLFEAPNASLNYDSPSSIRNSNLQLVLSHVPKTIFAPYIFQIMDTNVGNKVKVIFFLETLFNYILALAVLLFLVTKKLYKLFFVTVLFSCMYITNLFDSNFGTYLRHAYIFNKLFLGVGFLGMLHFLKPNIRIAIKKGF